MLSINNCLSAYHHHTGFIVGLIAYCVLVGYPICIMHMFGFPRSWWSLLSTVVRLRTLRIGIHSQSMILCHLSAIGLNLASNPLGPTVAALAR